MNNTPENASDSPCSQCAPQPQPQGFLPVPLNCVPFEALADLELHLKSQDSYALYRSQSLTLQPADVNRLIQSGVDTAYVPAEIQRSYYRAMEQGMEQIVSNPALPLQQKAEYLYATCIAMADLVQDHPPGKEEIARVEGISRNVTQFILQDDQAFAQLFAVSNHDFHTATHMVNVALYLVWLGAYMGLSEDELCELGTGAFLHDIGKLFVPKSILNARRKLEDNEVEIMRSHVEHGVDYLEQETDLSEIAMAVVREHHERLDGNGYPNRLKGDEISRYGRMTAIVDCFEAMTAVRPYRNKHYTIQHALGIIAADTPFKLDEDIFTSFERLITQKLVGHTIPRDELPAQWRYTPLERVKRMRRFYFRLPMNMRQVHRAGDKLRLSPPSRVIVHNLSASGVAILASELLEIGQNLHLTIPALERLRPQPLLAHVVRCREHGDGWYTIGARFFETQPDEIIADLRAITMVTEEVHTIG